MLPLRPTALPSINRCASETSPPPLFASEKGEGGKPPSIAACGNPAGGFGGGKLSKKKAVERGTQNTKKFGKAGFG